MLQSLELFFPALAVIGGGAMLAAFDWWDATQWMFNFVVTVTLGYIATKNREIATLRDEIKKSAETQIAERFVALGKEVTLHLAPVLQRIDTICGQLSDGERNFASLGERDHKLEIQTLNRLGELREYMHQHCATRKDVDELRNEVRQLTERMVQILECPMRCAEGGGR